LSIPIVIWLLRLKVKNKIVVDSDGICWITGVKGEIPPLSSYLKKAFKGDLLSEEVI